MSMWFRIGWAESERRACLDCLSPLSHVAKAQLGASGGQATLASTRRLAQEVFGGPLACPSNGKHTIDPKTGRVSCSLHGTAAAPQQPLKDHRGVIVDFAESLEDVRLELTFLEDGLHAVATVTTKTKSSE